MKPEENNDQNTMETDPALVAGTVLDSMETENPLIKYGLPEKYGNMAASVRRPFNFNKNSILDIDLNNRTLRKRLAILNDCHSIPSTWKKSKKQWYIGVGAKYNGMDVSNIYRLIREEKEKGHTRHEKPWKGEPRKWAPEAIDFYCGLRLKRTHRKMDSKTCYAALVVEANLRGWKIGSIKSAEWWYKKKVSVLMEAYSTGGLRQLDNLLPSVFRNYSDLDPFEMLVGDQNRSDFWVIDDDTLQLVRPECYVWVDLRTRLVYGVAVDRRYDAHLMALALRHGLITWGAFGSIFTDNGRPELSRRITGILANMRLLGLEWDRTIELSMDSLDLDGDEVQPCVLLPGTHKKAVVKNAKSKLIERFFQELKRALINFIKLPGYTKDMRGDIHAQDIDEEEIKRLAAHGKLPYLSEFYGAVLQACSYLNQQHHRGVAKEWAFGKAPQVASPLACLAECCKAGWRQRFLTEEAVDTLLLKRERRIVNKGRISYQKDFYEHDELIHLHGQEVTICCPDPLGEDVLLVFSGNQYLCTATPVSYSSMKDMNLARQKIVQKREHRKRIVESVRALTVGIPDLRNYPESNLEKQAAAISADQRRRAIEHKAETRILSQEELDEGVRQLEELNRPKPQKKTFEVPPRPTYWKSDNARHDWLMLAYAVEIISPEDFAWLKNYESQMTPSSRERWVWQRESMHDEYLSTREQATG